MRCFPRALRRLRKGESGFGMIEVVVSMGVIFATLTTLAYTTTVTLGDVALGRQRQIAVNLADRIIEQARGLTYDQVAQGMDDSDLTTHPANFPVDANIVTCTGVYYFKVCPPDPTAEQVVHSNQNGLPPYRQPIWPYRVYSAVGGIAYRGSAYVTKAVGVPLAGAMRITVIVTWGRAGSSPTVKAVRLGAQASVSTQILVSKVTGTTDPATNPNPGSGNAFFYGTGNISRGSVDVSPNGGVANGVSGFSSWDSVSQDLYNADANITQQQLTQVTGQATLTGSRKSVGGVETVAGDVQDTSTADDDPATAAGTSEAPATIYQPGASSAISGGGNSLTAGGVAAGSTCPSVVPSIDAWAVLAGFESGTLGPSSANYGGYTTGSTGNATVDSAVKRTGTYSAKIVKTSGAAANFTFGVALNQWNTTAGRFSMYLDSLPSADVLGFVNFVAGGTSLELGYQASTQKLTFRWGNQAPLLYGPVTAATWYDIDMKMDITTNPRTASWMVNGVAQGTVSSAEAAANSSSVYFGTASSSTEVFTAHFDDVFLTRFPSTDYPLGNMKIYPLLPSSMGTNVGPTKFQNDDSTAINANSYQRVDELPMTSTTDYVKEITTSSTPDYVEFNLQDTTETCIKGVRYTAYLSKSAAGVNNLQMVAYDAPNHVLGIFSGDIGSTFPTYRSVPDTWIGGSWTQAQVNALTFRFGYSSDISPIPQVHSLLAEYAVAQAAGGPPGSEAGATTSVVSATGSPACGNPTQSDSRACSYATESYSVSPPAIISTTLDLTGSGAGKCQLYQFTPNTSAGTTSVYADRGPGSGTIGVVTESIKRYGGTFTFGSLCSTATSPLGWLGYYLKYDTGSNADQAFAEAGKGSAAPSTTQSGTISVWTGAGYSTVAVTAATGAWSLQPTTMAAYSSGGFKYDIAVTASTVLASGPTYTSQTPSGASGTTDRTMARAVLGAPILGSITYKVTNASTSVVVADLTISIDMGTLTAYSRQA